TPGFTWIEVAYSTTKRPAPLPVAPSQWSHICQTGYHHKNRKSKRIQNWVECRLFAPQRTCNILLPSCRRRYASRLPHQQQGERQLSASSEQHLCFKEHQARASTG